MAFGLEEIYLQLANKALDEPKNEKDVRNILSCIGVRNGYISKEDEAHFQKLPPLQYSMFKLLAHNSREASAILTTTIKAQIYKDDFAFISEMIQNADDASYEVARHRKEIPSITFTVYQKKLVVDLNEDGFNLANVVAICSTGKSSKKLDEDTTGEKGFGFKAVFAIADSVHIRSNKWSFEFRHNEEDDGLDMITPIWRLSAPLPDEVRTRFTLSYSASKINKASFLNDLYNEFARLPVPTVGFLKRIQKIAIKFDVVDGQYEDLAFEKLPIERPGEYEVLTKKNGIAHFSRFRGFVDVANEMPVRKGRSGNKSTIKLYFPVKDFNRCEPLIAAESQFLFTRLPVRQIPELRFIIQADFMLTAGRQDVANEPWNQQLRAAIARTFAKAVRIFANEESSVIRFEWLRYLPVKPMPDFFQSLSGLIKAEMASTPAFISHDGALYKPQIVRLLSPEMVFKGEPLLQEPQKYKFLSLDYGASNIRALESLGVPVISLDECLGLLSDYSIRMSGRLWFKLTDSAWHEQYLKFVGSLLSKKNTGTGLNIDKELRKVVIIPVQSGKRLKWRSLDGKKIYFPRLVNERFGGKSVRINMPTDVNITVVHPDACQSDKCLEVYQSLGVTHCKTFDVCGAIIAAQRAFGNKHRADLLAHFELLFWYSCSLDPTVTLRARKAGGGYTRSQELFFHSSDCYHAAQVLGLKNNPQYEKYFLWEGYQASQVDVCRRGGMTWEQWLHKVAGVRWYIPLVCSGNPSALHPLINIVLETNPADFLPMLRANWEAEYAFDFKSQDIKNALCESLVLCKNNNRIKVKETWFPSLNIIQEAQAFDVMSEIPILQLPESKDEYKVTEWLCLSHLGVSSQLDLSFYTVVLTTIAARAGSNPEYSTIAKLYQRLGAKATAEDREDLQTLFESTALIWDPEHKSWLSSDLCLWESTVSLNTKFVVANHYSGKNAELFRTVLQLRDMIYEDLILELESISDDAGHIDKNDNKRLLKIYDSIKEAAEENDMARKAICSKFLWRALIYHDGAWYRSSQCIWHEAAVVRGHVPIKAAYPGLDGLFVDVLEVKTITDVFMMQELAKAAIKPDETIRDLILHTALVLSPQSTYKGLQKSIDALQKVSFLPCRAPNGSRKYLGLSDDFFILDDARYSEAFKNCITTLDFTYQEYTKLHRLVHLLGLDRHFLSRQVTMNTVEGDAALDSSLTERLHNCAYALSCCAVFHRSPLYFDESFETHNALMNVRVLRSPNMSTTFSVQHGKRSIEVTADKVYLVFKQETDGLRIVLPESSKEREKCLRGQLPKALANFLQVHDSDGQRQIHRFLNEIDMGTDELLDDEGIPHIDSWLSKTEREAVMSASGETKSSVSGRSTDSESLDDHDNILIGTSSHSEQNEIRDPEVSVSIVHGQSHRPYIPIHQDFQSEVEAPDYWRLLEHVRRQAVGVKFRATVPDPELVRTDAHATFLNDLWTRKGQVVTFRSYPELFGNDDSDAFRIGAAGELFVFKLLQSITMDRIRVADWQSKIRHAVRAVKEFRNLPQWKGRETADITYEDNEERSLEQYLAGHSIGDDFTDWRPDWLCGGVCRTSSSEGDEDEQDGPCEHCVRRNSKPLKWFFEVKTTLGPCETEFLMSPAQYKRMETAGTTPSQSREEVYCLVRVYDLLKSEIGIRIYIDPWRFRGSRLDFIADKWRVKSC